MRAHIIQGPRVKAEETRSLERLIQGILEERSNGKGITVSYNANNDMLIQVGAVSYNLTELLKHQPDWEQFEFTPTDLDRYKTFLTDPSTQYPPNPVLEEPAIRNQFPNLQLEELNAIRNYTGEFYTAINYLLRANGSTPFPNPNTTSGEFKTALTKFTQNNVVDLNQLVTEILLHSTMAASALSKPLQAQMGLCTAPSIAALRAKQDTVKGMSIALVGQGDNREFALVGYGDILTKKPYPTVKLSELLDPKIGEGLSLTAAEIKTLQTALTSGPGYQEVLLDDSLKARLLARLSKKVQAHYLHPEEDLYRADRHNPFMDAFVDRVETAIQNQDLKEALQAPTGFTSTSSEILADFLQNQPGIITHLKHFIGAFKDITYVSNILQEFERLVPPGQEFLYTQHQAAGVVDQHVHIHAEPVRSLNRIKAIAEAEDEILTAAQTLLIAAVDASKARIIALAAEAEQIVKDAMNEEINLTQGAEGKALSQSSKDNLGKSINAIALAATLELSEAERKITAIALEAVTKIEQISVNAKKDVSLAGKARQDAVTQSLTTNLVRASNKEAGKLKFFKPLITQVAEDAKNILSIKKKPKP